MNLHHQHHRLQTRRTVRAIRRNAALACPMGRTTAPLFLA